MTANHEDAAKFPRPIRAPSLKNYTDAENELFPNAVNFGQDGWRLWTPEERNQIADKAWELMLKEYN